MGANDVGSSPLITMISGNGLHFWIGSELPLIWFCLYSELISEMSFEMKLMIVIIIIFMWEFDPGNGMGWLPTCSIRKQWTWDMLS